MKKRSTIFFLNFMKKSLFSILVIGCLAFGSAHAEVTAVEMAATQHNLPNGFSKYDVFATVNGTALRVANIYAMDSEGTYIGFSKANFLSNVGHPAIFNEDLPAFDDVAATYSKKGSQVALIIGAAFESQDPAVIEGVALEYGVSVGQEPIVGMKHNVLFEITSLGNPIIHHIKGLGLDRVNQIVSDCVNKKSSLFQQFPVVRNNEVVLKSDSQELYRFYIEQKSADGDSEKLLRGVINFTQRLSLTDAANVIVKLNEKARPTPTISAVYMDVGGLYQAAEYDRNGRRISLKDYTRTSLHEQLSSDHYTNLLVFYSRK
jgi:hypothetical protein